MAIQIIDYSKIAPQGAPYRNLFEDVLKGYTMSQEPAKMKQESSARELANQLKKLDVEHKPKQYVLDDQGKSLANAMKSEALKYLPKERAMKEQLNQARIDKLNNKASTDVVKPNGKVANIAWVKKQLEDPNIDPQYAAQLQRALTDEAEHQETSTARAQKLNDTQYKRDSTPVTKAYDEIQSIQKGKFPGTDRSLTPEQQTQMQSSLMMDIVKKTTDPKTREKLINANNMNITLGSVKVPELVAYSGIQGQFVDKPADAIKEGFGEGSQKYKDYLHELNKATFAAKQMRQYLGDSIQPSAQEKLDKLAKPEAWNVSKETAAENFNFMRDLYNQESQTLVRAVNDPTLYQGTGASNNPTQNSMFANQEIKQSQPEILGTSNGITTIRNGGKTLKIPEKLVDRYMIEHSKSEFGGQYGR